MYKLTPVLKEKLVLWIIVNANNKNVALSSENAFLHKRSSFRRVKFLEKKLVTTRAMTTFSEQGARTARAKENRIWEY